MSKNISRNNAWQNRISEFSTHASRKGINLLGWEEEEYMNPEQEREALVAKVKSISNQLATMPRGEERKKLCKIKSEIEQRISKIRPKMKCKGIENYVLDVLRSELTKFQFDLLMRKAKKLRAEDDRKILIQSLQTENVSE